MSEVNHSPTPWATETGVHGIICDYNGMIIVDTSGCSYNDLENVNASYIVSCVNSHDALTAENARLKAENDNIVNCVNSFNPEIERIVRDAVVSYGEMFPSAPNDSAENELCYRAKVANDWLKSIGAEPEPFHYVKEGGVK